MVERKSNQNILKKPFERIKFTVPRWIAAVLAEQNFNRLQYNLLISMQERTPYQEKIIKRYYENREEIMQQKLAELTTDLYLAEGKKRAQVWKRIAAALTNIGVDPSRIDKLIAANDPAQLAEFLEKQK
jgi:hypothetical protein